MQSGEDSMAGGWITWRTRLFHVVAEVAASWTWAGLSTKTMHTLSVWPGVAGFLT